MSVAARLSSGKDHRDENFPVASFVIAPRYRPAIMAFYRFARAADDVADHAEAGAEEKLHLLENMWRTLHGEGDLSPEALELRRVLDRQGLPIQHALQLLEAFRRDVSKSRYANWDELIEYCHYSAMPVGRFVLDVHGESRETWPASDALCAALQVINHLQDCGKDFRALDRVYVPQDVLAAEGVETAALGAARASPALLRALASLAHRSCNLLTEAKPLSRQIANTRLALEVSVVQRLAEDLSQKLTRRDPLSQRVHHRKDEALGSALIATLLFAVARTHSRKKTAAFRFTAATIAAMSAQPGTAPEIEAIEKKAAGSSFYTAMRVLPKSEREAMFAIYAFCRAVDDIADDGKGTRAERKAALDAWRAHVALLYTGSPGGPANFLARSVRRYGLRKQDFLTVIDGMAMDVTEDIVAPDTATLDLYCERVASAVGRLSVKVFGMEEEPGFRLAHHLGRALQLTNILRDLDEDAAIGRLYLASEALAAAGIAGRTPREAIADARVDKACREIARTAHEHYRVADAILAAHPKGRLRAPRLMGAVYGQILARMEAQGWAPPRQRARIGKGRLLLILLRHGLAG